MNDTLVNFETEQPVVQVFKNFDRSELDRIVGVLSERLVTRLWDSNGRLEYLEDDGRLVPVTHDVVRLLVRQHFRTPALVQREGKFAVELAEISVDRQFVTDVMHALLIRAAKAPIPQKELTHQQWTEIRERLQSGEPVRSVAGAYALNPVRVQEIRDGLRA
jgi:hypothetical protein